jgi:hypothetical protein
MWSFSFFFATALHQNYGHFGDPPSIVSYIGLGAFLLIYLFHGEEKSPLMWGLFALHNIALVLWLWIFSNAQLGSFLFSLSSILFLGGITYAMVMGHWYLVTPKLSETPLKYAIYITWAVLAYKLMSSTYEGMQIQDYFVLGTSKGGGYSFNWMMLSMRVLWGYVVTGVMSYFAWRLVRMRSIQSATGILYAMTFFVFVGEMISNYMFLEYGMKI